MQRLFLLIFLRLLEFLDAVGADVLALVNRDVLRVAAEHAGRLVLFQNDRRTVHINFNGVLFRDVQCAAKLDPLFLQCLSISSFCTSVCLSSTENAAAQAAVRVAAENRFC